MAATIDQQFVEYIVKTLVNNPDKVEVTRTVDEKGVLLSLEVDPEDVGRVIGRRGATAQSIRTLLRALGTKNDARYNLKIINNDDYVPADRSNEGQGTVASDDSFTSEEAPAEESTEETEAPVENPTEETEENSDALAEKTRADLADLDDLDI
ncbi:KH domain-containing protein [Christensenellaceae bacterium OttesenSCG-928-L17]|nr:KH domain-containing protein [Christensenellaceae bacterium OttesenSCG-928-L17]